MLPLPWHPRLWEEHRFLQVFLFLQPVDFLFLLERLCVPRVELRFQQERLCVLRVDRFLLERRFVPQVDRFLLVQRLVLQVERLFLSFLRDERPFERGSLNMKSPNPIELALSTAFCISRMKFDIIIIPLSIQ